MNHNPCLTLEVALVLISEKVRFWSDEEPGIGGRPTPPRCMDTTRLAELRKSLIEIDGHCKTALKKSRSKA
jgi:hypothetical protein